MQTACLAITLRCQYPSGCSVCRLQLVVMAVKGRPLPACLGNSSMAGAVPALALGPPGAGPQDQCQGSTPGLLFFLLHPFGLCICRHCWHVKGLCICTTLAAAATAALTYCRDCMLNIVLYHVTSSSQARHGQKPVAQGCHPKLICLQ